MSTTPLPFYASSKSTEWYTPQAIITAAIEVMGAIDLDPCSNPPPYNVTATLHMTRHDNGLLQHWSRRVFLNPPFGRKLGVFMAKLENEIAVGRVKEAITLTPARTDTQWFQSLWRAQALCFVEGRLQIGGVDCPFPSVIGYYGKHAKRFATVFGSAGQIVYPKGASRDH